MGDARLTGAEHNMHDGQECDVRCATIAARFTNPPNVELATTDCCALGSQTIVGINGSMVNGTSVIRTIVGIKRFGPARQRLDLGDGDSAADAQLSRHGEVDERRDRPAIVVRPGPAGLATSAARVASRHS